MERPERRVWGHDQREVKGPEIYNQMRSQVKSSPGEEIERGNYSSYQYVEDGDVTIEGLHMDGEFI